MFLSLSVYFAIFNHCIRSCQLSWKFANRLYEAVCHVPRRLPPLFPRRAVQIRVTGELHGNPLYVNQHLGMPSELLEKEKGTSHLNFVQIPRNARDVNTRREDGGSRWTTLLTINLAPPAAYKTERWIRVKLDIRLSRIHFVDPGELLPVSCRRSGRKAATEVHAARVREREHR